jgi:integrase
MASIKKRPNGAWRARYRDDSGREHAKHFDRRVDAQRWIDEQTAAIMTGQFVHPKAGRITVREYAATWERSQIGRTRTLMILDVALRRHVLPRLGDLPLSAVTRSDVQGLVKAMEAAGKQPRTVRGVYRVMARLFAAAVDDRRIASSPCRKVSLPRVDDTEVHPPTVEQIAAMVDAVPERFRALVVLLAGSGVRIAEAIALRPSDVDFLRRTLRVERQRTREGTITAPKSARSTRTVPLARVVVDELAAHMTRRPVDSEWLFPAEDGGPLSYMAWYWAWEQAKAKAGLPDLMTHDLRHFCASALIAGGASVKIVQSVLGHSSAVVTLAAYAHMWPGDDERTRAVIESTLGVLRTPGGLNDQKTGVVAGPDV